MQCSVAQFGRELHCAGETRRGGYIEQVSAGADQSQAREVGPGTVSGAPAHRITVLRTLITHWSTSVILTKTYILLLLTGQTVIFKME